MKSAKVILACFCLAGLILLWQCFDKTEDEFISSNLKEFLCFEKGSNWLYLEDSTGVVQYYYVDQVSRSTAINQIDKITYHNESIFMELKSTDSSTCSQSISPYAFGIHESLTGQNDKSYFYVNCYKGSCLKTKDTTVLGVQYKDVCHLICKFSYRGYKDQFINEYWIARNKWVIRKIIRTPERNWYWSLKECKIVQ